MKSILILTCFVALGQCASIALDSVNATTPNKTIILTANKTADASVANKTTLLVANSTREARYNGYRQPGGEGFRQLGEGNAQQESSAHVRGPGSAYSQGHASSGYGGSEAHQGSSASSYGGGEASAGGSSSANSGFRPRQYRAMEILPKVNATAAAAAAPNKTLGEDLTKLNKTAPAAKQITRVERNIQEQNEREQPQRPRQHGHGHGGPGGVQYGGPQVGLQGRPVVANQKSVVNTGYGGTGIARGDATANGPHGAIANQVSKASGGDDSTVIAQGSATANGRSLKVKRDAIDDAINNAVNQAAKDPNAVVLSSSVKVDSTKTASS